MIAYVEKNKLKVFNVRGMNKKDKKAAKLKFVEDNKDDITRLMTEEGWIDLNPEGFDYADSSTHRGSYLEGAARAFVDKEAMTSVTKDRSRLFWQAMQPDNQDMFASEIMQAKLNQLCLGIRQAWRWQKESQVFPWEQYLNTPIAVQ